MSGGGMNAVTIREARTEDRAACLALWARLQDEHERLDARLRRSDDAAERWEVDFDEWVTSRFDSVLVAEVAGEVVGLLTAHPYWPAPVYEEQLDVYVTELYVLPEHRGSGIARRLVEAVRVWAREIGAAQVRAGVLAANPEARRFWAQVGSTDFIVTVTLPLPSD